MCQNKTRQFFFMQSSMWSCFKVKKKILIFSYFYVFRLQHKTVDRDVISARCEDVVLRTRCLRPRFVQDVRFIFVFLKWEETEGRNYM